MLVLSSLYQASWLVLWRERTFNMRRVHSKVHSRKEGPEAKPFHCGIGPSGASAENRNERCTPENRVFRLMLLLIHARAIGQVKTNQVSLH